MVLTPLGWQSAYHAFGPNNWGEKMAGAIQSIKNNH